MNKGMKNILKLHEAIVLGLINCKDKKAAAVQIANEINRRKLYIRKEGQPVPSYQIMMRTKMSKGKYTHLFDVDKSDIIAFK